jgi:hypothetical protein
MAAAHVARATSSGVDTPSIERRSTMVTIVFAGYGIHNLTIDVTKPIADAKNRGQSVFLANNNWGGDPAPGQRKYLYIVWEQGDERVSGVTGEDDGNGIIIQER